MPDVRRRVAMAQARADKLRHIWPAKVLHLRLRLRLYISGVCSIMTYGSEAWFLTREVCRVLNGANSRMVARITGQSIREEATIGTRTFNLVKWIRARRLKWVGHILRLEDSRMIKQALQVIYDNRQEGDILMDIPKHKTWQELVTVS